MAKKKTQKSSKPKKNLTQKDAFTLGWEEECVSATSLCKKVLSLVGEVSESNVIHDAFAGRFYSAVQRILETGNSAENLIKIVQTATAANLTKNPLMLPQK